LKVWSKDLQKYFETGDNVRVISGTHTGGSGIITALKDKVAVVSMDGTKAEFKILIGNLKCKGDDMEHIKMQDFISKSLDKVRYIAGDLIKYDSGALEISNSTLKNIKFGPSSYTSNVK
jgi:hypothetical protein